MHESRAQNSISAGLEKGICMIDIILILLVAVVIGAAIRYIVKEKKKGTVCIGCPMAGNCSKLKDGGCDSHTERP